MLFGLCSGLIFDFLKKILDQKQFTYALIPASIVCAFLHTFFVVLFWYIFGVLDIFKITAALGLGELVKDFTFQSFVLTFLVWGSIVEICAAGIINPILYSVIYKVFHVGGVKKIENPVVMNE